MPRSWVPSQSFEATLHVATQPLVHTSEHMAWMHANWDVSSALAPPAGGGAKGLVRRVLHRMVMAVIGPYVQRVQDYVAVNTRAMDTVSRRVDDQGVAQLRLIGAVRRDLIDFAHHVDQRIGG